MTKPVPVMMGIASPTGSHLQALTAAIEVLAPGDLVIEHGAGLYSTPLCARYEVEVLCAESHPGWAEWARWMYSSSGRDFEIVPSWKRLVQRLGDATLVFIDGVASERAELLLAALSRRVPRIIAHDTNEKDWSHYGWRAHHFTWAGYDVSHFAEDSHRTTVWRLRV